MRKLRLVLVEPEGKINMGFIIRLCKNFSIEDICVVNPAFSLDDPEIVEFSAKASDYLKKIRLEKNLEKCLKGSKVIVCTTSKSRYESDLLRQGVSPHVLSHILPSDGIVSLVFGRESVGLRRSELKTCDIVSKIETGSPYNVMNLSHAIAIYLYELSLRSRKAPKTLESECSERSLKSIRRVLKDLEEITGDWRGVAALKNAIFRSNPRKPECGALYKFLKKIKYRLMK